MKYDVLKRSLVLIALIASPDAHGEDWQKLNTVEYVLNNKQDALSVVDPNNSWYGNGTGRVYQTKDGGKRWRNVWSHPGTYVRALEFSDINNGYLGNIGPGYFPNVTDRNPLYVTHDGGKNWAPAIPIGGPRITGICAIDISKVGGKVVAIRAAGRVGGPAGMLESFDEGRTWHAKNMSDITGMILDIRFVDSETGFLAGASAQQESEATARILKTVDSGKTWKTVFQSQQKGDVNWKLAFPTPRVGYATIISYGAQKDLARGYIAKTEDGGEHWASLRVTSDPQWIPYGIGFLDEMRGWVGGSTGGYETRDGGLNWSPVDMGLSVNKIKFAQHLDGSIDAFAIGSDVYKLKILP